MTTTTTTEMMDNFERTIIGLIDHTMDRLSTMHPYMGEDYANLNNRTLRLSFPRGAGNTRAAVLIMAVYPDSCMVVPSNKARDEILHHSALPGPENISNRISTASYLERLDGPFTRGATAAVLSNKRSYILITDGTTLSPEMMIHIFQRYKIALLVKLG